MSDIEPYGQVPEPLVTARREQAPVTQNPVSFIGATKRLWPLGRGSAGWVAVARWTGVGSLILLAWVGVLVVYTTLTALPVLWIGWAVYTIRRRHFIYDRRRYGRRIGD
jgi:hypothetical protein